MHQDLDQDCFQNRINYSSSQELPPPKHFMTIHSQYFAQGRREEAGDRGDMPPPGNSHAKKIMGFG